VTVQRRCCECGKTSDSDIWQPGEVCLFGMLFACSLACAESYARQNAMDGFRPGESGFDVEEWLEDTRSVGPLVAS
jgi:hypothetical protein